MEPSLADDKFIQESARTMIRAHNGSAALLCAENASKWNGRGDLEAAELWLRILQVVRSLEAELISR